jgi:hypothetical protein
MPHTHENKNEDPAIKMLPGSSQPCGSSAAKRIAVVHAEIGTLRIIT